MTTAEQHSGGPGSGAATGSGPRVVFYDPVSWQVPWSYDVEEAAFAERGVSLVVPPDAAAADEAIRDADIVVACGLRQLDAAAIATLRNAAGILCYSIGMNQVDQEAAAKVGIPVHNVPFCVDEVSDHALTLLLAAERRLILLADAAGSGEWDVAEWPDTADSPLAGADARHHRGGPDRQARGPQGARLRVPHARVRPLPDDDRRPGAAAPPAQ